MKTKKFSWTPDMIDIQNQCHKTAIQQKEHNLSIALIDVVYAEWKKKVPSTKISKPALKIKISKIRRSMADDIHDQQEQLNREQENEQDISDMVPKHEKIANKEQPIRTREKNVLNKERITKMKNIKQKNRKPKLSTTMISHLVVCHMKIKKKFNVVENNLQQSFLRETLKLWLNKYPDISLPINTIKSVLKGSIKAKTNFLSINPQNLKHTTLQEELMYYNGTSPIQKS